MNSNSRTKNVSVNAIVATFTQFLNFLISFVSRTVFIKVLGTEYLGVNGLFSNILTILSFAELGIGSAIIYNLYKPLAIQDRNRISSLMLLYKKAYTIIGFTVLLIGVCFIPFLKYIIKEKVEVNESITLIYFLFLTNTVVTYFLVYKKSILTADQKNYIVLLITEIVHIIHIVVQIILLLLFKNYILYLINMIIFTIITNIVCSFVADKKYPFLKDKATPLSKTEVSSIFKDVRALALYRFSFVILNGTDNIIVSSLIGTNEVGLVSNYVLLTGTCSSILGLISDSFTASVGNLNAIGDKDKKEEVFKKLFFITAWLFGFATVGLLVVSKSFIITWIGTKYLLSYSVVLGLVADFYVRGVHFAAYTYRTTMGYFVQGKYAAVLAAVINIVLSVFLCNLMGLAGVFIATPISRIITTGLVDPIIIYRKEFHKNPLVYYLTYFKHVLICALITIICNYTISFIQFEGWIGVVCNVLVVTVLYNSIMVLLFFRTNEFTGLLLYAKKVFHTFKTNKK